MALPPGSEAPDFALRNQHGETLRLSEFHGVKNVVLLFFPFAFTPTCTGELTALRDAASQFVNDEVQLLAVSNDSPFALRAFAEQHELPYPLLSDFWPHGEVSRTYRVFDEEKGCAVRGTYVIDTAGQIRWSVINDLPDARDISEYTAALRGM